MEKRDEGYAEYQEYQESEAWRTFCGKAKRIGTMSKQTYKTYTVHAAQFLDWVAGAEAMDPDQLITAGRDDLDAVYGLVDRYIAYLVDKDLSPKSVYLSAEIVKRFFALNGIFLNREEFKAKVTVPRAVARTVDRIPEEDELSAAYNCANGVEERAAMTTLVSSGMRMSELAHLEVGDLHLETVPASIWLKAPYTKGKKPRIVFITPQARSLLKEFIAVKGFKEGDRLFTHDRTYLWYIVMRPFIKAGIPKKGRYGRYDIHPHSLRKYAKTKMLSSGMPEATVNKLLGHMEYLSEEYFKPNREELAAQYSKAVDLLTVGKLKAEKGAVEMILDQAEKLGIMDDLAEAFKDRFYMEEVQVDQPVEGGVDFLHAIGAIFPQELKEAFKEALERKGKRNPGKTVTQKVIHQSDLDSYLNDGWRFVGALNREKVIVDRCPKRGVE